MLASDWSPSLKCLLLIGQLQVLGEKSVGNVGGPMAGMEVRLMDWPEGNYSITDKPYPRGEFVLGGEVSNTEF